MTRDLLPVLHEAPASSLFLAYVFGVLWGLGGLTFGLTMCYLGMSLGMAAAATQPKRSSAMPSRDGGRVVGGFFSWIIAPWILALTMAG